MTDPVLQSFCERCGTRYTFSEPEAASPEQPKSRLGLFGRRPPRDPPETDPATTPSLPLSAERFAGTFHFCLDCRQYVCTECWNQEGGGCLSCRPPERAGTSSTAASSESSRFHVTPQRKAWPDDDVARAPTAETAEPPTTPSPRLATPHPVERDEWGRPRQPQSARTPAAEVTPALIFDAQDAEMDPWQGVVFSADEASAEADLAHTEPPPPAAHSDPRSSWGIAPTWPKPGRTAFRDEAPAEPPAALEASRAPEDALAADHLPGLEDGSLVDGDHPDLATGAVVASVSVDGLRRQAEPEPEPAMAAEPLPPVKPEPAPEPEPRLAQAPEPQLEPELAPEPERAMAAEPLPPVEPEPAPQPEIEPEPEPAMAAAHLPPVEPRLEPMPASGPAPTPTVPDLPWPPSPIAPILPPQPAPKLEVWNVRSAPGPFDQPYQAPPSPMRPLPTPPPGAPPSAATPPLVPPVQALPAAPAPSAPPPSSFPPPPMAATTAPPTPAARSGSGPYACTSCGLPLSAKARFCRRCGAPQG